MKKFPINFLRLAITSLFLLFTGIIFSQTAPVTTPKGGFKIDGHLRANTPAASRAGDWLPQVNGTAFTADADSFVLSSAGVPEDAVTTRLKQDAYNTTADDIFTQGSKFADAIGALRWGTGGAPNKNDIHNGVFHASGDNATPSNQWVFIGGDRLDVNGTSYIDFQFLQGTVTLNGNGTFTGSGICGGRTVDDINVSMEYNNGGTAPKVVIYRWVPTNDAGTAGTWDSTGSASITSAYAQTNLVTVDVPFGGFGVGAVTYQPFAFVEAAINVTQLVSALGGNCAGLSIKTLWITTKASSSSTAALKDFMTPISLDLNFGGVSIDQKGPLCALAPNITLTGSPAGGTFSGPGVTGSTFSATDAGVGSHRIIYTASAGVNCEKKDTMWIVVNPNPTVTVNSPAKCASDPAVNITATPGSGAATDYNYAWSVPAGAPAPGNVPNFTANVAGNYTVVITHKTTGCSSAAAQGTLLVNANPDQPNVTVVQPTCGNSNGTVTVTAPLDGGGNDYEYKNNSGSYQESPVFTVAAGAAYSIVVRNKTTGCVSLARAGNMGSAAGAPDAKAVITQDVSCSNSIGTVKIVQNVAGTVEFSATDFEFSSNNSTWGSNPEFSFTAGGGYHLYVRRKSDNSCVDDVECIAAAGKNNSNTESEATARSLGSATLEESTVTVKATPNPFSNQVRFTITNPEAGSGTLDIYNMAGQKIKTVYDGHIPAGASYFDLNLATRQVANLVYVLRIGDKKMTG